MIQILIIISLILPIYSTDNIDTGSNLDTSSNQDTGSNLDTGSNQDTGSSFNNNSTVNSTVNSTYYIILINETTTNISIYSTLSPELNNSLNYPFEPEEKFDQRSNSHWIL